MCKAQFNSLNAALTGFSISLALKYFVHFAFNVALYGTVKRCRLVSLSVGTHIAFFKNLLLIHFANIIDESSIYLKPQFLYDIKEMPKLLAAEIYHLFTIREKNFNYFKNTLLDLNGCFSEPAVQIAFH